VTLVRLRSLLAAALALGAVAVLWRYRPEWPQLPSSLSSPVTTVLLQQLVLVAAWLLSALLFVLLLVRSLVALVARPHRQMLPLRHREIAPGPRRRSSAYAAPSESRQSMFPPPFPLIPRGGPERTGELRSTRNDQHSERARREARPHASIALLGPLAITTGEPGGRRLRSKARQLVIYLALHARGATTDELAAAVFPDLAEDSARRRVWRSISEVRAELGDVLARSGDRYLLDRKAVAIDIDEFDIVLAQANTETDAVRERLLKQALALVRGDPLAGTDYPWAAGDVRHLRAKVVALLHELGELRLADGNATGALAAAERAIEFDADDESAQQLAMRAEAALGLRDAIVDRYERLCKELDTRFGLEPDRETRALYRRLLSQDATGSEAPAIAR
jgi:DNA-binding SARP family transcriptional activator